MRYLFILLLVGTLSMVQGCAAPLGSGGSLLSTSDRRTAGTIVEDDTIENKSRQRIEDKFKSDARVTVVAFNRLALITGEVKTENMKMDVERIVGSIPNVKDVANELMVATDPKSTIRNNDSRIDSNVRARFSKSKAFASEHIRVVTDAGVVYLMGLVTHAESNASSEIASTTVGVQKVVRAFEYID